MKDKNAVCRDIAAAHGVGGVSVRGAAAVICMILMSTDLIYGTSREWGQNAWIPMLAALVLIAVLFMMYARIARLRQGQTLFDMMISLFGKIIGRFLCAALALGAAFSGALTLSGFGVFINQTSLVKTPVLLIIAFLMIAVLYVAVNGTEILGRWSTVVLGGMIAFIIFTGICSISYYRGDYFLPVISDGYESIMKSAVKVLSYPFGEAFLVLMVFGPVRTGSSPYKTYLGGGALSYLLLLCVLLRCIATLGGDALSSTLYPSFRTAGIIRIGSFLERIEYIVSAIYMMAGIAKAAVCLIAAVNGITAAIGYGTAEKMTRVEKTGRQSPRVTLLIPTAILTVAVASVLYNNTGQFLQLMDKYILYSLPVKVGIPLLVWAAAEIHTRGKRKSA